MGYLLSSLLLSWNQTIDYLSRPQFSYLYIGIIVPNTWLRELNEIICGGLAVDTHQVSSSY